MVCVIPRRNRPVPPRDEDREQLQADLTRLVGTGRLQFDEFDRLCDVVWSTQDKSVLDHIRAQYLSYRPPAPMQQQPPLPNTPVPMAQPDAHLAMPVENQPVVSTMGAIRSIDVIAGLTISRSAPSSAHRTLDPIASSLDRTSIW